MPTSSTLTTKPRGSPGARWLRTSTADVGGENVVAFSISSASRWATSATARPATSRWSLTWTSTRRYSSTSAAAARTTSGSGTGRPQQARRLVAGQHEQRLGVAADAGGQVVELEQLVEDVGLALALLEVGDQPELAVEQRLVAPGQVDEQLGHGLALLGLGGGHRGDERDVALLLALGVLPEDDLADAGGEHRHAVDDGPGPRPVLRRRGG